MSNPAHDRSGASHDVIALPPIHWRVLRDGKLKQRETGQGWLIAAPLLEYRAPLITLRMT